MIMGFLKKKKEIKEEVYDDEEDNDDDEEDDSDDVEYHKLGEDRNKKVLKKNPQEKVVIEREVNLSLINEKLNFIIEQLNQLNNS